MEMISHKNLWTTNLHYFLISILFASLSEILNYHYALTYNFTTYELVLIESWDTYLDIQTISNQKSLMYNATDHVNFDVKFVLIRHHMRNLWSFRASYRSQFKPRTGSDSITTGFSKKATVITQNHCRFMAKIDSDVTLISLSVGPITVRFSNVPMVISRQALSLPNRQSRSIM